MERGELMRLCACVYAASDANLTELRPLAAARSTGGALSHQSSLAGWGLREVHPGEPVHVTVEARRRLRPRPGVLVHRADPMPAVVRRAGVRLVGLERTLVDCWTTLGEEQRRAAVIRAVRERRTTPARIRAVLTFRTTIRGARQLAHLIDLLEDGCHSELEIWGLQKVLLIPGLPRPRQQIKVAAGGRVAYLDAGWEEVKLAVEFDGAAVHGESFREGDLRRDAWLASLGWLVIRVSYRRLVTDPEGVRREIAAAYDVRRVQLHMAAR
ncbi:MAG: DUF559 domain-containing protein [Geodermatophilaceae bacterium]